MTLVTILSKLNSALAGELLTYQDVEPLLDEVVDDINAKLNSEYPTFSECKRANKGAPVLEYNYIPDRYIRSVIITGAAYKFYVMDEEGIDTATTYGARYEKALFEMLRDFGDLVPKEYEADDKVGSLDIRHDVGYTGGVSVYGAVWNI